jgi:hypothetical protein
MEVWYCQMASNIQKVISMAIFLAQSCRRHEFRAWVEALQGFFVHKLLHGLSVDDASITALSSWSHYQKSKRSNFFSEYQRKVNGISNSRQRRGMCPWLTGLSFPFRMVWISLGWRGGSGSCLYNLSRYHGRFASRTALVTRARSEPCHTKSFVTNVAFSEWNDLHIWQKDRCLGDRLFEISELFRPYDSLDSISFLLACRGFVNCRLSHLR